MLDGKEPTRKDNVERWECEIIREKVRVASFIKNRVYLLGGFYVCIKASKEGDQMKDKKLDRWKGRHTII